MSKIYSSITETIGHTPLVRLARLTEGLDADVLLKIESFNPANSVKDRVGAAIIEAAEESGELSPGGTIVEATSGNTGIALAMVGAARGYNVVLTMPETMSAERRVMLRAYGAEIILTPGAAGMQGAVDKANEIVEERPGAILASQFTNQANPQRHYDTTGPEIVQDTDGKVDVFVAGVGTGGTVSGVGRYLKDHNADVHVVAVEPADSPLLSTGKAGPHKIQGLGANFVPETFDRAIVDEIVPVTTKDAVDTARALGEKEGILGGISSGANVWTALRLAADPAYAGKTIVTVITDFGERYVSTLLYEDIRN